MGDTRFNSRWNKEGDYKSGPTRFGGSKRKFESPKNDNIQHGDGMHNDERAPKRSFIRNSRCRLFIANLPPKYTEKEFEEFFKEYSPIDAFIPKDKTFGFVQLKTRQDAEKAKLELDGKLIKGKSIRISYCQPPGALKVKHLSPFVSNELLQEAFSQFGEVERAVVLANEKGKSIGEGIVEFASKKGFLAALHACTEGCFLLTNSIQPVEVEEYIKYDDEKGVPESSLPRHIPAYSKDREKRPRMLKPGSFEYEVSMRWKKLYEEGKQRKAAIDREMQQAQERLNEDIEGAYYEHQTRLLREQLKELEERSAMYQQSRTMRESKMLEEQRLQEEMRRLREEEEMRHQELLRAKEREAMQYLEEEEKRRHEPIFERYDGFEERGVRGIPPPPMEDPFRHDGSPREIERGVDRLEPRPFERIPRGARRSPPREVRSRRHRR